MSGYKLRRDMRQPFRMLEIFYILNVEFYTLNQGVVTSNFKMDVMPYI